MFYWFSVLIEPFNASNGCTTPFTALKMKRECSSHVCAVGGKKFVFFFSVSSLKGSVQQYLSVFEQSVWLWLDITVDNSFVLHMLLLCCCAWKKKERTQAK